MESPPDGSSDPLRRLDTDLAAFEASRGKAERGGLQGAAEGYRLLSRILGGVLGGVGFGWLADKFFHTAPWGIVGGLVIGTTLSIVSAIRGATRMGVPPATKTTAAPVADDDDDED